MSSSSSSAKPIATSFFSHCWGVFEGGGVRAAAHAGAFAAAREAGIAFGRVAGTSGGSIVAALVAAGAPAQDISRHLEQTDLAKFLVPADPKASIFSKRSLGWKLLRRITWGNPRLISNVALDSGLYSSKPLQNWLESLLLSLVEQHRVPGDKGPVRFKELQLPLHIVATDLTSGRPKIWSLETTPEDSVSFAVRCSCSIPFFYQAIANQQSVLVDGGAVSNLPSFVFTQMLNSGEGRSVLSRVLAFRLTASPEPSAEISGLLDFASRLSSAVIDGASHIQSTLQPNVYDIAIHTGSIKSTDFRSVGEKEKKQLHAAGATAVHKFVGRERIIVRSAHSVPVFHGFDEKLLILIQELQACESTFFAVGKSTYWLEFVFPTILSAARRGIQIVCITAPPRKDDERRRISLLSRLGADIELVQEPQFDGFLFDIGSNRANAILSFSAGPSAGSYEGEVARLYSAQTDRAVLEMLSEKVAAKWSQRPLSPRQLPYTHCSDIELFQLLSTVRQYGKARFEFTEVDVNDNILVLQEAVKEFKVLQIKRHMQDLRLHGCEFFDVTQVTLLGGAGTIVTPPVLERLDSKTLVLIDGNTRFFHCLATGIKSVGAVVVDKVTAALPAQEPKPLSKLRLISSTTPLANNYKSLDVSLFRHIEQAVHPNEPDRSK